MYGGCAPLTQFPKKNVFVHMIIFIYPHQLVQEGLEIKEITKNLTNTIDASQTVVPRCLEFGSCQSRSKRKFRSPTIQYHQFTTTGLQPEQKLKLIHLLTQSPILFLKRKNLFKKLDSFGATPVLLTCAICSRWPITSSEIADVLGEFNL